MSEPTTADGFAARLPVGRRLPVEALEHDDLFPFEGEIRLKPMAPPILPEPTRRGAGGADCWNCSDQATAVLWSDERWMVRHGDAPSGLPAVVTLIPRQHHDVDDLPAQLATELGMMISRVSRAIGRIPGVGRVHFSRWGDGSEHFHLWFLARPRGQWQMRGAMLAAWDDILPKLPEAEWRANLQVIADGLREDE